MGIILAHPDFIFFNQPKGYNVRLKGIMGTVLKIQ